MELKIPSWFLKMPAFQTPPNASIVPYVWVQIGCVLGVEMTSSPVGPTTLLSRGTHIYRHLRGSVCNPVPPALFLGHGTVVKEQKSSEHFCINRQSFLMPVVRKVLEKGYTGPNIRRKCPCPSNLPRRGCGAWFLASPCRPGCLCAWGRGGRGDVYLVLQ